MSIFENNDYDRDRDYQSYLDWKDEQAELDKEYELAEEYERDLQGEKEEVETTGERCLREAQEPEVHQLAQVKVQGVYRYERDWLPETHVIRVEISKYHDGSPMSVWYPDTTGTLEVFSKLLFTPEDRIRITDLAFFTEERVIDDLFESERRQFTFNTWRDYAQDGMAMQFNVEIVCPHNCYDAACDGTNCEFNTPRPNKEVRPHGIDGTQCDCSDCTLDYGLCSCGCAGNHQVHAEWLEEREKEKQEFVHETATPLAPETLAEYMKDYMDEPEPEADADDKSETSLESAEEKESRLWSDFKLAMMSAFLALMLGVYLCRTVVC